MIKNKQDLIIAVILAPVLIQIAVIMGITYWGFTVAILTALGIV